MERGPMHAIDLQENLLLAENWSFERSLSRHCAN
jgi:hypothetical protein